VPDARTALDLEIQKRNLDPERLRKQRPRSLEKRRRPLEVEKRLKDKRLHWRGLVAVMISSGLLLWPLYHFGIEQFFWPISITVCVPVFTVWGFWELRGRLWFWAAIVIVVAANTILFDLMGWPWGTHWVPGRAIAGLCTLELIPIFALIALLQKRIDRDDQFKPPVTEPHSPPAGKIVD
jgi:hypothetical protein